MYIRSHSVSPGLSSMASRVHRSSLALPKSNLSKKSSTSEKSLKFRKIRGRAMIQSFAPHTGETKVIKPLQSMCHVWNAPVVAARAQLTSSIGMDFVVFQSPRVAINAETLDAYGVSLSPESGRPMSRALRIFPFGV